MAKLIDNSLRLSQGIGWRQIASGTSLVLPADNLINDNAPYVLGGDQAGNAADALAKQYIFTVDGLPPGGTLTLNMYLWDPLANKKILARTYQILTADTYRVIGPIDKGAPVLIIDYTASASVTINACVNVPG
jgi:hypothetical protein